MAVMTGRQLEIAPGVTLPPEAVTETFAILAKRGVGKTYTASVLAEEMIGAGAQVVILDPLDAWWGLRSSADGKGDGLPIYVFGGEHGDLPLEAGTGTLLADVLVDYGVSAILSLRHLSKTKQREFVAAFAERLYHRKGEPQHRTPLQVIIDEADAFVPQRVTGELARSVGAIDDLVRRGRSSGIGVTLISQRAAVVNKDVLTQAEVLIALRTISPQDRKALEAWVEAHDARDQHDEFMASLASLEIGEAWVWSPGWLDLFARVRIRQRRTFDSSATPKAGAQPAQPAQRTSVDLAQLRERMADVEQRAAADDPKKLKVRIRELEKSLKEAQSSKPQPVIERVEVPVLNGEGDKLAAMLSEFGTLAQRVLDRADEISDRIAAAAATIDGATRRPRIAGRVQQAPRGVPVAIPAGGRDQTAAATPASRRKPASAPTFTEVADGDIRIGKGEHAILSALAMYPEGRTKRQVAFLTGYTMRGGRFGNLLSGLRKAGLIEGSDPLRITDAGVAAVPDAEPLPTGSALRDHWLAKLGKGERAILRALIDAYPQAEERDTLAALTGYEPRGGRFGNLLSALSTLELIERNGSTIRASGVLFE